MTTIATDDNSLKPAVPLKRWISAQSPKTVLGHKAIIEFLRVVVGSGEETILTKHMANEILDAVEEKGQVLVAPPVTMERQISQFSENESKLGRKISFRDLAIAVKHMSGEKKYVAARGRRRSSISDGLSIASIESLLMDFEIEEGSELAEEVTHFDNVTSPEFNILSVCDKVGGDSNTNSRALEIVGYSILIHYSLIDKLRLDPIVLKNYLKAVGTAYNEVPYHNAAHGADVMQTMAANLKASPKFLEALSDESLFAALIGACVHDVGHPGENNLFLDKTEHELALRYNDQSILENYHISYSMELMQKNTNCNILKGFTKESKRAYRKILIHCILETDLAKHGAALKKLNLELNIAASKDEKLDACKEENHIKCLGLLMHCCDISNPAKEWSIYRKWTNRIVKEFNNQYDKEEKLGVSHGFYNPKTPLPEFQIGFINFMVLPFYVEVNNVEGLDLSKPLFHLNKNLQAWKLQLVGRSIRSLSSASNINLKSDVKT